jgi:hypothetical protein
VNGHGLALPHGRWGIFLVAVIVVRAILSMLARRAIRNGSVSEQRLETDRADTRPD